MRNKKRNNESGFTLIELMVVISIFLIISGIAMFNYGSFKTHTSLQNLSDDIALSVRKAQGYAIGVRGSDNKFNIGYGIHFSVSSDTTDPSAGSNKSFILFANLNNDEEYNSSGTCGSPTSGNECLEIFNITSSDKISNISVIKNKHEQSINDDGSLDIFFKRPNPEPTFCARNGNGNCNLGKDFTSVKIEISNDKDPDSVKTIIIGNNGQISVE